MSTQNTPTRPTPWGRYTQFAALALISVVIAQHASAADSDIFKTGLGGEIDTKTQAVGTIIKYVTKAISAVMLLWGFVSFMKSKEWINILYIAIGIAGLGWGEKLVAALYTWGETGK